MLKSVLVATLLVLGLSQAARAFDQTVFDIQQGLIDLGYDPGPADGASGANTRRAIAEFLDDQGLNSSLEDQALAEVISNVAHSSAAASFEQTLDDAVSVTVNERDGTKFAVSHSKKYYLITSGNALGLYETATGRKLRTFSGHTAPVTGASMSPDDRYLATAAMDGTVRLWDAASGQQLFASHSTCEGGTDTPNYADPSFSFDSRYFGSHDENCGYVTIWDTQSRVAVVHARQETRPFLSMFVPGRHQFAFAPNDNDLPVSILDADTGKTVQEIAYGGINSRDMEFSSDGTLLAIADGSKGSFGVAILAGC